jgi:mono/diheme cytochrome c family protein
VRKLFLAHCVKCHGANGTGSPARGLMPEIPDLTKGSWQRPRSDAQLLVSILDGKGTAMPPWRGKVSTQQARGLVAYVRAFAPTRGRSAQKKQTESRPGSFEERYRRLEKQLEELKSQKRELTKVPKGGASTSPSKSPQQQVTRPLPRPAAKPAARPLYRQYCVKCHDADGTGKQARRLFPAAPNFTKVSWQKGRSDAQLLASILDGKGSDMPAFRGKFSAEKARGLVAYVRAFASTGEASGQKKQKKSTPASFSEGYDRLQKQLDELKGQYRRLQEQLDELKGQYRRLQGQLDKLKTQDRKPSKVPRGG